VGGGVSRKLIRNLFLHASGNYLERRGNNSCSWRHPGITHWNHHSELHRNYCTDYSRAACAISAVCLHLRCPGISHWNHQIAQGPMHQIEITMLLQS